MNASIKRGSNKSPDLARKDIIWRSSFLRTSCQDPLGFDAGDSNFYRYVTDNPTNATDPTGLDEKEALRRLKQQLYFGVPAEKDAPMAEKIYSEKDAPVGLKFCDEYFWNVIREQMSGKPGIFIDMDKGKNIARENVAAKAMMGWRDLKGLDINIYYIGNDDRGPEQFLKDAATKGYGSVNLFFGHGGGDVNFNLAGAVDKGENPDKAAPSLFGIGSCYARNYNGQIPAGNRIPITPTNAGKIIAGETPREWTPMIEAVDKIIRDRMQKEEKIQLNIYFGEMSMNSFLLDPQTGRDFMEWHPHPDRFRTWKWKE